jgi:CheY-like chemotaxis protein
VGLECYGANDAEAAVKIVSTTAGIRLIITDFQMPGETGAYLVRAVETKWEGKQRRKKTSYSWPPYSIRPGLRQCRMAARRPPATINMLIARTQAVHDYQNGQP